MREVRPLSGPTRRGRVWAGAGASAVSVGFIGPRGDVGRVRVGLFLGLGDGAAQGGERQEVAMHGV